MSASLEVQHVFDAAHRLPFLPGKCTSLHGHTWRVTATITGPLTADGIVVDMGLVKDVMRKFIDQQLDHGTMLGASDPLVGVLRHHGTKVFTFDGDGDDGWRWPTVEAVAAVIGRRLSSGLVGFGVDVARVRVSETDRNAAVWP